MKKQFIILMAALALVITHTSCTSSETDVEGGDQIAAESGDLADNTDPDAMLDDGSGTLDQASSPETVGEGDLNDPNLQSAPSDGTAQVTENSQPMENSLNDPNAPMDQTSEAQPAPIDTLATTPPPAPTEEVQPTETLPPAAITEAPPVAEEKPKPHYTPYKKMESTPWSVDGKLINTVYFARPGDTLTKISEKIYGDKSKVKDLKKANQNLAQRVLWVGDKVYYNSPNRPDDSSKIITFYEDKGVPAQTYTTKEGDNVKSLSADILGFKNAWKEVWASNSFESKGKIDPGIEIKYWSENASAPAMGSTAETTPPAPTPDMASNELPPPPSMNEEIPPPPTPDMAMNPPPPPTPDMGMNPPPPPPDMGMNPPPPPPDMAMNTPPPPPPPDMAMNTPPPPPPPDMGANHQDVGMKQNKPASEETSEIGGMDQDTIFMAAGGAALLILLAIVIVRRKNRQREEFEQAMNETQVG